MTTALSQWPLKQAGEGPLLDDGLIKVRRRGDFLAISLQLSWPKLGGLVVIYEGVRRRRRY